MMISYIFRLDIRVNYLALGVQVVETLQHLEQTNQKLFLNHHPSLHLLHHYLNILKRHPLVVVSDDELE